MKPAPSSVSLLEVIRPEVRDRFRNLVLRGLTPDTVQAILQGAFAGQLGAQHELFELMEDSWPRLAKNLTELKRSVQRAKWHAQPYAPPDKEPTTEARRRAAVMTEVLSGFTPDPIKDLNGFNGFMADMCDAVGKGLSVQELMWEVRPSSAGGTILAPRNSRWIPARFYGWPTWQSGDLLLYPSGLGGSGVPFPEHKFLVAAFKARTGLPMVTALLRPLATFWIGASFSYDWALNLAQIFGLPFRWATYDPANEKLRDDICEMLENMGSAAWGAFPHGTQLEFLETKQQAGNSAHAYVIDMADKAADLLILGQTLTGDAGEQGSRALGEVHMDVRQDIIEFVASWAGEILTTQLGTSICQLNFGDTSERPTIVGEIVRAPDAVALAERDKVLVVDMKLPVSRKWLYDRHDVPIPKEGEDLFQVAADAPKDGPKAPTADPKRKPVRAALQAADTERTATDKLIERTLENLVGVEGRWLGGVKPFFAGLVEMAKSDSVTEAQLEDTLARAAEIMPELFADMDHGALEDALYAAMSSGLVNGVSGALMKRRKRKGGAS